MVWLQLKHEGQTYHGKVYARTSDGAVHDLGWGYTGSLQACGNFVYFIGDHKSKDRRLREPLMRWSPQHRLQLVWIPSVPSPEVLGPPNMCDGTHITIGAIGGSHAHRTELATARAE